MINVIRKNELSQETVKQFFFINEAGKLCWLHGNKRAKAGQVAGSVRRKDGYHSINFFGTAYSADQLKHFYLTGEWKSFFREKPQVTITVAKTKPKVKKKQIKAKETTVKFYDNNDFWEE